MDRDVGYVGHKFLHDLCNDFFGGSHLIVFLYSLVL